MGSWGMNSRRLALSLSSWQLADLGFYTHTASGKQGFLAMSGLPKDGRGTSVPLKARLGTGECPSAVLTG